MSAVSQIVSRHFSAKTLKGLARKGVQVVGLCTIPDMSSGMPFANGSTGYNVDDNGTGRVLSLSQVLALAEVC